MRMYLLAVYRYIKETFAKTRDQLRTPPNMNPVLLQVVGCPPNRLVETEEN